MKLDNTSNERLYVFDSWYEVVQDPMCQGVHPINPYKDTKNVLCKKFFETWSHNIFESKNENNTKGLLQIKSDASAGCLSSDEDLWVHIYIKSQRGTEHKLISYKKGP